MFDEPISKRIPNAKHRLFIDELFKNNMNQTVAYMAAYPDSSYESAGANASRLIENDRIQAEIERRLKERAMAADEVLARLADMARASLEDFVTFKDGINQPFLDLPKAQELGLMHLIKKMKYDRDGRLEIELHDSQAALEKLGRWHNLFANEAGSSEEKPFIIKVIKGVSNDDL